MVYLQRYQGFSPLGDGVPVVDLMYFELRYNSFLACQATVTAVDWGLCCCVSCYVCQVCRALLIPFVVVFGSLTCLARCGELHRANFYLHSSSNFIFRRPLSTFPAVGYCGKRQTSGDVFHFASSVACLAVVGTLPQTTARPWTWPPLNACGGRLREYWGAG